jgi:hypothetical protein
LPRSNKVLANDVVCELFFGQDFDALAGEKVGPQARPRIRGISDDDFCHPQKPSFIKGYGVSMTISGISAEFHPSNTLSPSLTNSAPPAKSLSATPEPHPARPSFSKMADSGEMLQLSTSQEACNLTIAGTDTAAIALTYLA